CDVNVITRGQSTSALNDNSNNDSFGFSKIFSDINMDNSNSVGFAMLQKSDASLVGCYRLAEQSKSGFIIDENSGILYKDVVCNHVKKRLLVLPECKRDVVLKCSHDNFGHFGTKKTLQVVSRNFTFPKMKEAVCKYVSSCLPCAH